MITRLLLYALLLAGGLLGGPAVAEELELLGLYDGNGQRFGIIRGKPGTGATGRVDAFDAKGNRTGFGRTHADGTMEWFDAKGNRVGTAGDGRLTLTHPARSRGAGRK